MAASEDGPDGSGGGTNHTLHNWFAQNKNKTGSGGGCAGMTQNSNAGGLSNTTPYGKNGGGQGTTRIPETKTLRKTGLE